MKELSARADATASASPADALALLRDVEGYPNWYPEGVRSVAVTERDAAGAARGVRAVLHVAQGPLQRDFALMLAVEASEAGVVSLRRIPHDEHDPETFEVSWRVSPAGAGARIALSLEAHLDVPRLLPIGGVGAALAEGFVGAAVGALADHAP
jgi:ribosome-associated toxin RatA of RatAB toxin-antitoxin module